MKRLPRVLSLVVLLVPALIWGQTSRRFDVKLTPDKQVTHVLSRLTFGARPGDAAEVRRVGIERWIDLQLHPERILENPVLEARVEPLESLKLQTWQINEKYAPPQRQVIIQEPRKIDPYSVLTPAQITKLNNGGTVDERREVLMSLLAETRSILLLNLPDRATEGLPEFQEEAVKARQAQQQAQLQARQAEQRRLNPPLNELLAQDQIRQLRQGTDQEKLDIINSLDPQKRQQVLRSPQIGPQLQGLPQLRREAMRLAQPQQAVNAELIDNKLYRAIYSNHQLEEVLVDFWINHFNVFKGKAQGNILLTSYERDAIRPYVFGHFRDMLLATARHPAMLIYLDNVNSQAPRDDAFNRFGTNQQPQRRPGLNENYGRELMELHTLGVDGGYTQDDVIAVARAFTGWTVANANKSADFNFNDNMHDRNEKRVLEQTLPPGRGEQDGIDVIDILVHHPSTAKFISKKLAQRFVADDPPQSLIDRMAATFTKTDGDLRAVLQTMFSSVEFSSEGAYQSKLKSPLEIVVSSVRALNADAVDAFALAERIANLGQPLYGKVEPTGYPNTGEGWASTAGLLGRINFATDLTTGHIPGVKPDMSRFNFKRPPEVATELLGTTPAAATIESMEKGIKGKEATPSLLATIVLSSPEFQRR
jgi:uncharacterized protein (DUF1800 family)